MVGSNQELFSQNDIVYVQGSTEKIEQIIEDWDNQRNISLRIK